MCLLLLIMSGIGGLHFPFDLHCLYYHQVFDLLCCRFSEKNAHREVERQNNDFVLKGIPTSNNQTTQQPRRRNEDMSYEYISTYLDDL